MVYIGLRQWEKAMYFLEAVLITPTQNTTSTIMVQAYSRWLLLGLLLHGKRLSAPKTAHPNVLKNIKAIAKAYDCLADIFETRSTSRLSAEIQEGQEYWEEDVNMGLVMQLVDAHRKFAVLRLANTFAAIPISEVARRTSPNPDNVPETKSYLTSLIESGEISAQISNSVLRFLPSKSSLKSESAKKAQLASATIELQTLLKHVSDNDHKLEVSKEYIEMLKRMKKAQEASSKNGTADASGGNVPNSFNDYDEDMMADI